MMDDRVAAWLEHLGLGIYRETFQSNAITWDVLTELNQGDLESLGVLLGHRKTLLRAIAQLSSGADVLASGSLPSAVSPDTGSFPPERDQAERRQLTVVFCDLVDSTALSRRVDPEDLQEITRRFLDACSQAIGRFNGYVAKYMGDGLLVYFGYPHAHEDDTERAVYAGLAILDTVKVLNHENPHPEFSIAARIGIATGPVVVGEVMGQDTAKERSVFGATPNLANRLQSLAQPNQLIIDPATKRLVGNAFDCADLGAVMLKGFDTPVHAWQVLSSRAPASRFESYRSSHLTNFVGREQEFSLLLGRWHEAVGGEGQVVLLCGEAGIGKSRMIRIVCVTALPMSIPSGCNFNVPRTIPIPRSIRRSIFCGRPRDSPVRTVPRRNWRSLTSWRARAASITRKQFHCLRICSRSREITGIHRSRCQLKNART